MQFEIQTKSRVLAGLFRDDTSKPEGVLIKLPPSSYEKREITIQEIIVTFLIVISINSWQRTTGVSPWVNAKDKID